jgi:hypothetical protein
MQETYPHLVSSQIPHILLYIYTVKQSLCNLYFKQSKQAILPNIFANEQYHSKLMFSEDIELNPGPVFL